MKRKTKGPSLDAQHTGLEKTSPARLPKLQGWQKAGWPCGILVVAVGCACLGRLQQSSECEDPDVAPYVKLLCELKRMGGIVHPALQIHDSSGYRSVVVTRKVAAGEVLFWIPAGAMIQSGEHPSVQAQLGEDKPTTHEGLATALLIEKRRGPASVHVSHLATLPIQPMSFVMYPEEIQALLRKRYPFQSPEELEALVESVQRIAASFVSPLPTKVEVMWALGIVSSRASSAFEPRYPIALLPVYDMLNHGYGSEPHITCSPTGWWREGLACKSPGLQAGSEVLHNYGDHPMLFFLGRYGFLPGERRILRRWPVKRMPDVYNCTQPFAHIPHNPSKDALWATLRCYRMGLMRTTSQGPEIQEFASSNGWFDLPFSVLPHANKPVGSISGYRVWYLTVVEGNLLKSMRESLGNESQQALEGLEPLLMAMRAKKADWASCFQLLAEKVEAEVQTDLAAMQNLLVVLAEMQQELAWTEKFTRETAR